MDEAKRPKVGVGVIIVRDSKVLMGKRLGTNGSGTWNFPGGHLEFGETPEACAEREVKEETGLKVTKTRLGPYTNDYFEAEGKHYITLFVVAEVEPGDARLMEPDRNEAWGWFEWDHLPQPLFLPIKNLLKRGFRPSSD